MALSVKGTVQEILGTIFDATNNWLSVTLGGLIEGEDQATHVMGVFTKPVASAAYSPSRSTSFGTAVTAVARASAGAVVASYASNANAAVRYFQLHNVASALSGGETPITSIPIPAGTANNPGTPILMSEFYAPSSYHGTGVTWAVSTTNATYTAATASDHNVIV